MSEWDMVHRFISDITNLLKQHQIYISIGLCLSIFFSVNLSLTQSKLYILSSFLPLILLLLIASKMAIISLFITLPLLILHIYSFKKFISVILLSLFSLLILIFSLPNIKARFNHLTEVKTWSPPQGDWHLNINSTNMRIGIWYCAAKIIKNNPLYGVGNINKQSSLEECYKGYNTTAYDDFQYNSHNQYLESLLAAGIPCLISFLSLISYLIYISIKEKNLLLLSINLFFSLEFIVENIFEHQIGCFFWGFGIILSMKKINDTSLEN
ncbi:hypothetical protein HGP29_17900 [Flammeovirga sp. SR4]|uniref:O-antigen ligase-related domain-containing protein n=2 Tax=Flammeovirga agarivorans TaxID=2726742 RepID=A0A7X8XXB5_9BACT|nr:hypothetical protein [Flammeovirga agarivorans]